MYASDGNQCRLAASGEETQKGTQDLNLTWYLLACLAPLMTCFVNAEKRSHGWIFDYDAQLLGSRLMLVRSALGLL